MKPQKTKTPEQEAAFVLEKGDKFHSIIVSDSVPFEDPPAAEALITVTFRQLCVKAEEAA